VATISFKRRLTSEGVARVLADVGAEVHQHSFRWRRRGGGSFAYIDGASDIGQVGDGGWVDVMTATVGVSVVVCDGVLIWIDRRDGV
jgi:hypothetical protein